MQNKFLTSFCRQSRNIRQSQSDPQITNLENLHMESEDNGYYHRETLKNSLPEQL